MDNEAEQIFEQTIQILDQETLSSPPATEQIHRDQAISRLRKRLIEMSWPGQSICEMAGQRQVFCGGFRRHTDEELRARYGFLDSNQARAELELQANAWQIRRQVECGTRTSCDAQWQHYETCRGWDDFTNGQLAGFFAELMGVRVEVVGEKTLAVL